MPSVLPLNSSKLRTITMHSQPERKVILERVTLRRRITHKRRRITYLFSLRDRVILDKRRRITPLGLRPFRACASPARTNSARTGYPLPLPTTPEQRASLASPRCMVVWITPNISAAPHQGLPVNGNFAFYTTRNRALFSKLLTVFI